MAKLRASMRLLGEFVGFARANRIYWIVPLVLVFGLVGLIIVVGQTSAPLVYALF